MKAHKIDELKRLLYPRGGNIRMIRKAKGGMFTDMVEIKPLIEWQKQYDKILFEPKNSCYCLLFNFDLPSEVIELLGTKNRTPRDEIRLDELINETLSRANNESTKDFNYNEAINPK